jgi:3-oxoacyl-[acyl-carrier-protein] synthase-3
MSRLLDPDDLGTSIISGDGVGAAVVMADSKPGIGPVVAGSDGAHGSFITVDDAGLLRMRGPEVFRWAVELVPGLAHDACLRAGVRIDEIDVFVPHQANLRIIDAVVRSMSLRADVAVATDIVGSGNTSSASIPIALRNLEARGVSLSGSLALLVGFGAGLSYAAQVVVLP